MTGCRMEVTVISPQRKYILLTAIFVITTVASIWLIFKYWDQIAELQQYGYVGAFVIAFIAGSSIPTPISYLALTFVLGARLDPNMVAIISGAGAGIGGTLVFLLGRGGRRLFPGLINYSLDQQATNKVGPRFLRWAQKRGSLVVFIMSAMLNPVFAPMAIAMGALRFRLLKFFILCVAGNIVKAFIIAYAGYFGIGFIQRLFGG
jgi:membrane protein YqaA with SNARE-associated domain